MFSFQSSIRSFLSIRRSLNRLCLTNVLLMLTITVTSALASVIPHRTSAHWKRHHHRDGHHGLICHHRTVLIIYFLSLILTFFSFEHIWKIFELTMDALILVIFILLSFSPLFHFSVKRLVCCFNWIHFYSWFFWYLEVQVIKHMVWITRMTQDTILIL